MAKTTTTHTLSSTWTKIADAGQSLFIQILPTAGQAMYAYKATAPGAENAGHILNTSETLAETGIGTHLWMRAVGDTANVAASVGGTAISSGSRATTQYNLTGSWTQIAASGENVEMDAISGLPVRWAYSSAAPATLDAGHIMYPGEEYIDAATDQNIWARSETLLPSVCSTIVVTRG